MATLPKYYFHNKSDFHKSLRRMRQSGGVKQAAAEKVEQIIGQLEISGTTLAKLTNHGESRIKHAVKYDLPGFCRLVTIQNNNEIWLLYVGDHEEVDAWLEAHKGMQIAANKKAQIQPAIVSPPGNVQISTSSTSVTSDDRPLLDRILFPEFDQLVAQAKLRRDLKAVTEDSTDDEIQEIVECVSDPSVQSLLIDLFHHLRKGQIDEALTRIDIHFGRAKDIVADPASLAEAMASGENTELVTELTALSPAERKRLFSEDFEPWLLWLHPDQKRVVEEDFDMPAVLKGVSGSGKTVILIHRARRLAQKYPDQTIGVLTLNRSLARLIENLLRKLCLEGEEKRIKVEAFYDYFQAILRHTGTEQYLSEYLKDITPQDPMAVTLSQALRSHQNIANEFSPQSGETLDDTWEDFWRIDEDEFRRTKESVVEAIRGRGDFDVKAYLRDEFTLIRSAFPRSKRGNQASGESYFQYKRQGRSVGLLEKPRQNILRMLRRYEEYMLAGGLMDELALSQALLPIRTKLGELPNELKRRCLLIDEFQDFSTLELSLLKQIPLAQENGLFLAGDTVQKVLVKDFNLGNALLDRNYTRTRTIAKNYRNSRQILLAAHSLVKHYGEVAARSDQSIEVLDPELAVRETAPPLAIKAANILDVAWDTAIQWVKEGGRQPWSVCLASANPDLVSPAEILKSRPADVLAERLGGDYILNRDRMVVGTLSEVKGFEFSLIVIVGCDADKVPDPAIPADEQWRDALRFYVAMTRGRDQVVAIYRDRPSEFLEKMREHLVWKDSDFNYTGPRAADSGPVAANGGTTPLNDKFKQFRASTPKIVVPEKRWDFSTPARTLLLSYFERRVFPTLKRPRHAHGTQHLVREFERWLKPQSLDRVAVSELFQHTTLRRDIANEIEKQLKPFGCSLHWDV